MSKTIIFDVDGTLIDATEGIIKSVKYTIEKFDLDLPTDDILLTFVGPPIQDSCKKIFNMTSDDAQLFANCFRTQYANGDVFISKVYDGIYELLDFLKKQEYRLGVATYKRQDYAIELMKHFSFDKFFDSICGADNENKLKKIDILKNCMNELMGKNENTIMVGDSLHDAKAAVELDCKFIGVTYGFGFKTEKDLEEYKPIFIAKSPNEILEFFENTKVLL